MSIKYLVKKGKPCFEFCIVGEHKVIDNAVEDITSAIEKISGAKFETFRITAKEALTGKNKVVFTTFDSCKELKEIFPDEYNFLYGSDGFTVKEYKDNVFIVSHMPRGVYRRSIHARSRRRSCRGSDTPSPSIRRRALQDNR